MIRALIGLLIAAIAMAFIRGVIGMITREVSQMMKPESGPAGPSSSGSAPGSAPGNTTALSKCAVCGVYTPTDRLIDGKFCSQKCASAKPS